MGAVSNASVTAEARRDPESPEPPGLAATGAAGGPLIQLDEANLPDWMFIWEHDFDSIREQAYEYVQKVVQRYRKAVSMWNVVAGLNTNSAFSLSFEQIIELTRLLVSQV